MLCDVISRYDLFCEVFYDELCRVTCLAAVCVMRRARGCRVPQLAPPLAPGSGQPPLQRWGSMAWRCWLRPAGRPRWQPWMVHAEAQVQVQMEELVPAHVQTQLLVLVLVLELELVLVLVLA